jgi:hypothetical protein
MMNLSASFPSNVQSCFFVLYKNVTSMRCLYSSLFLFHFQGFAFNLHYIDCPKELGGAGEKIVCLRYTCYRKGKTSREEGNL